MFFSNYNKLERPVMNEAEAVVLSFGLTLQQIIDVVSYFNHGIFLSYISTSNVISSSTSKFDFFVKTIKKNLL